MASKKYLAALTVALVATLMLAPMASAQTDEGTTPTVSTLTVSTPFPAVAVEPGDQVSFDLTILAPDETVIVAAKTFRSRSRNTPFDGWTLRGGVAATIVGGRAVYVNESISGMTALRDAASRG